MKPSGAAPRRLGRPLSFDRELALAQAMKLFWRQGYETTSIADLCAALQITPPSLYAAFGDKKRLFLEAADAYATAGGGAERWIDDAATAAQAVGDLLDASASAFTGDGTPAGCLLASAAATGSPEAADVRAHLAQHRRRIESRLAARLQAALETGEVPRNVDPETFAALVMAVIQGMSVLARDGAPREKLLRIAQAARPLWSAAHVRSRIKRPNAPTTG